MADRVLFRWKGATIMGDENGRPLYPRVGADFPGGSPVWGKGGAIAALLARVEEVEAERDRLRVLLMRLVNAGEHLEHSLAFRVAFLEARDLLTRERP